MDLQTHLWWSAEFVTVDDTEGWWLQLAEFFNKVHQPKRKAQQPARGKSVAAKKAQILENLEQPKFFQGFADLGEGPSN